MDEIARFRLTQLVTRLEEITQELNRLAVMRLTSQDDFLQARARVTEIASKAYGAKESARAILRRVSPSASDCRTDE